MVNDEHRQDPEQIFHERACGGQRKDEARGGGGDGIGGRDEDEDEFGAGTVDTVQRLSPCPHVCVRGRRGGGAELVSTQSRRLGSSAHLRKSRCRPRRPLPRLTSAPAPTAHVFSCGRP